ncbi:MAG TPA: ATP synthase F1 subunit delta [Kiritimatiellia bacterium]|nr:ATP synthase F1 subunit delta [Kiritimatiellia bacterium]HRU69733.1 ATP synthase F1 subunit delta [Kiritimatiellia bacterium]
MTGERYARAFARALHGAATARGEEACVTEGVRALEQLWQTSPEWRRYCHSRQPGGARVRVEQVRQLLANALSATVMQFLEAVAHHDQLVLLPEICKQYQRLEERARGCSRVRVLFACEPTEDQIARVRDWVAATRGPEMDMTVCTEPALIAGLRIFVDDTRVDASLAGRLKRLRVGLRNPVPAAAGENEGGRQV